MYSEIDRIADDASKASNERENEKDNEEMKSVSFLLSIETLYTVHH